MAASRLDELEALESMYSRHKDNMRVGLSLEYGVSYNHALLQVAPDLIRLARAVQAKCERWNYCDLCEGIMSMQPDNGPVEHWGHGEDCPLLALTREQSGEGG